MCHVRCDRTMNQWEAASVGFSFIRFSEVAAQTQTAHTLVRLCLVIFSYKFHAHYVLFLSADDNNIYIKACDYFLCPSIFHDQLFVSVSRGWSWSRLTLDERQGQQIFRDRNQSPINLLTSTYGVFIALWHHCELKLQPVTMHFPQGSGFDTRVTACSDLTLFCFILFSWWFFLSDMHGWHNWTGGTWKLFAPRWAAISTV